MRRRVVKALKPLDAVSVENSVYAGTDALAIDTIALEVVEQYRKKKRLRSLAAVGRPASYLKTAAELGLGIGEREKILLEKIDLPPFVGALV